MEWPKLKNIILLLLLLLNLFLLVLVGEQAYAAHRAQTRMREETLALLALRDIHVSEQAVPWGQEYQSQVLRRDWDEAEELSLAEKLVGGVEAHQAGSPTLYSGPLGTAQFYQSGQFALRFNPGAVPLEGRAEGHAPVYLKALGLSAAVKEVREEGGSVTVELWQLWQAQPVLTCQITMVYQGGFLTSVRGMRLSGETSLGISEEGLSPETLLIRLLGATTQTGVRQGYEIRSILPGYLHQTSGVSAQRVTLIPVWQVETDEGERLLLNCLSGMLEQPRGMGGR